MHNLLTQFAAIEGEASETGIFGALGINWQMLAFQTVAFIIVVWLLGKFVYPVLLRVVDERERKIESGLRAAREAENSAANAEDRIAKQLAEARKEARDIVATAKDEASALLAKADDKAKANTDNMIQNAREEITKETAAARKMLHNETIELVAMATEKVAGKSISGTVDDNLIKDALKGADK